MLNLTQNYLKLICVFFRLCGW